MELSQNQHSHEIAAAAFVRLATTPHLILIVTAAPKCEERELLLTRFPGCSKEFAEDGVCHKSRHRERLEKLITSMSPEGERQALSLSLAGLTEVSYGLYNIAYYNLMAPAHRDWARTTEAVKRYVLSVGGSWDDTRTSTKEK